MITEQQSTNQSKMDTSSNENESNRPDNEQVKSKIAKIDSKQFYESSLYNEHFDKKCFGIIETQSKELCKSFNEDTYLFTVNDVKEKKMKSFVDKLKNTELFLICFQIKIEYQGKSKTKTIIDLKVRPGYLDKIETICILLGDKTIYRFANNQTVQALVKEMNRHDFEFVKERIVGVCFDAKMAFKIFKSCFEMNEKTLNKIFWHDTKVAHWLLNPDIDEPKSLLNIAQDYLELDDTKQFLLQANDQISNNRESSILFQTILLYPIISKLRTILIEKGLFDSYTHIELPVLLLFGEMELNGFTIDILYLKKSINEWTNLLDLFRKKISEFNNGQTVNPRSHVQVHNLLEKNGLYQKYLEDQGLVGEVSVESLKTGKDLLDQMRKIHPLAGYILDMRTIHHLIDAASSFEQQLGNSTKLMGIYKHFISTGRVSMHDPNLLGIDNAHKFKLDENEYELSLKKAFKAKTGFKLIAADYCQLELRILAALSNEDHLKSIFDEERDPFKLIAAKIKNKEVDEITQYERDSAKQIIYSIIYGVGIKRLTINLNVESEQVAMEFLNEFHSVFPNLKSFIEQCKEDGRENGYVETLFNRKRILPDINAEDEKIRGYDERKAVNSRIQGSASDLVKLIMLRIDQSIKKEKIEAEILLQVHDELIFQVKDDKEIIKKFVKLVVKEMTGIGDYLKTKFQIKVKEGTNWGEMNEINLEDN